MHLPTGTLGVDLKSKNVIRNIKRLSGYTKVMFSKDKCNAIMASESGEINQKNTSAGI